MRPSFSTSSFSPPTTRCPRFTCVSDGYPLRRLLLRSKARFVGQCILSHGCLPFSLTSTMGKVTRTHSLVLRTSHMPHSPVWSGRRESNSRHQLGRLRPMPLDHARSKTCAAVLRHGRCGPGLWLRRLESNQRGMDYETTLESRSSPPQNWLWRQDSNLRSPA